MVDQPEPVLREDLRVLEITIGGNEREYRPEIVETIPLIAVAAAPQDVVASAGGQLVEQLDVVGVEHVVDRGRLVARRAVPVRLDAQAVTAGEPPVPVRDQMSVLDHPVVERALRDVGVHHPAVQRERLDRVAPVRAEVPDRTGRVVAEPGSVGPLGLLDPRVAAAHANVTGGAQPHSDPRHRGADRRPDAARDHHALRLARRLGDHVDHAVHRVGAPRRAARSADHLDAFDVLEHDVLRLPEHPREQRRIDGAAVHQHQHLVREHAVESARRDRVLVRVRACDVEVGRQPQRLLDGGGARALDLLGGDDVDRRRRLAERLLATRHRRHRDVGKLLEREIGEVGGVAIVGAHRPGERECEACSRADPHQCTFEFLRPRHAAVPVRMTVKVAAIGHGGARMRLTTWSRGVRPAEPGGHGPGSWGAEGRMDCRYRRYPTRGVGREGHARGLRALVRGDRHAQRLGIEVGGAKGLKAARR